MTLDELYNNIGNIPIIKQVGTYSTYEPTTTHKNVLYFASDQNSMYYNNIPVPSDITTKKNKIYRFDTDKGQDNEAIFATCQELAGQFIPVIESQNPGFAFYSPQDQKVHVYCFDGISESVWHGIMTSPSEINLEELQIPRSSEVINGLTPLYEQLKLGKKLSTNDYTDSDKAKVDSMSAPKIISLNLFQVTNGMVESIETPKDLYLHLSLQYVNTPLYLYDTITKQLLTPLSVCKDHAGDPAWYIIIYQIMGDITYSHIKLYVTNSTITAEKI